MKEPNLALVGSVVIDRNRVGTTAYVSWGSPAMFMTQYLKAHHRLAPTVIASYGPDFLPYLDDVAIIPRRPNLDRTVEFNNIVTDGHRVQYCHFGEAALPPLQAEAQAALSKADILVLAPLTPFFPADFVDRLTRHVSRTCLKMLLPQGYLRTIDDNGLVKSRDFVEVAEVLPSFDIAVLSDEDHPSANEVVHDWERLSPATAIVLTENARGADIVRGGSVEHVPTVPVPPEEIEDPIGLGDVFGAALAYHFYRTNDLVAAVQAGHRAALAKLLAPSQG
ncbi:MAG TPA: PfkB family carbohydrate kinase [Acidimicrobiales bacterium]|nr:PfkB family carbohydrate kinase [Acidimicrobiales bacterium]